MILCPSCLKETSNVIALCLECRGELICTGLRKKVTNIVPEPQDDEINIDQEAEDEIKEIAEEAKQKMQEENEGGDAVEVDEGDFVPDYGNIDDDDDKNAERLLHAALLEANRDVKNEEDAQKEADKNLYDQYGYGKIVEEDDKLEKLPLWGQDVPSVGISAPENMYHASILTYTMNMLKHLIWSWRKSFEDTTTTIGGCTWLMGQLDITQSRCRSQRKEKNRQNQCRKNIELTTRSPSRSS